MSAEPTTATWNDPISNETLLLARVAGCWDGLNGTPTPIDVVVEDLGQPSLVMWASASKAYKEALLVSPDALFSPWSEVANGVKDSLIAAAEHGMYVDLKKLTDHSRGTFRVVTGAAEYRLVLTDRKRTLQRTDGPASAADPVPIVRIEKLVVGEPGCVEAEFEDGSRTVMHVVQVGHELRTVNVVSIEHVNASEWSR